MRCSDCRSGLPNNIIFRSVGTVSLPVRNVTPCKVEMAPPPAADMR
jgi:hypothetical protein